MAASMRRCVGRLQLFTLRRCLRRTPVRFPDGLFYGWFSCVHLSGDDSRDRCVEGS